MKKIIVIISGVLLVMASCKKKTARDFPDQQSPEVVELSAADIAWVEQVARQKADSMRVADSLAGIGGTVDTNSLFHKKNIIVAYVEVNNVYYPNVACFRDENDKPVVDLAIIFAPNINIDPNTGKAGITYNTQTAAVLNRGLHKRVQQAGVKAGMCILGNHDNAGWRNFRNKEEATAFAQVVAMEVRKWGLDAVDADDEWSLTPPWANDSSFVMVMSEIKRLLPDKFVMCYLYGGATSSTWNSKKMGDIVDCSFTAMYPQTPSTSLETNQHYKKSQLGASTSPTNGSFSNALTTCTSLRTAGYKGVMMYNFNGRSTMEAWLRPYVQGLKEKNLVVRPNCLNAREAADVNVID